MTNAERQAKRLAKAQAEGKCSLCRKRSAYPARRKTCRECRKVLRERAAVARAAKK